MQLCPSAARGAAASVLHRCGLVPGAGCVPCCQHGHAAGDAGTELAEPRGTAFHLVSLLLARSQRIRTSKSHPAPTLHLNSF